MRLLLDTNALIWWLAGIPRFGDAAEGAIAGADQVFASAVSGYEVAFKRTLGKLVVPDDFSEQIDKHGFDELPVTLSHAIGAGELPLHHRDPFDRLLVAQARCEGLTLVTSDRKLAAYDVPVLDAGS